YDSANATAWSGWSAVAWTHVFGPADTDIWARTYNPAGAPFAGPFPVALSPWLEEEPPVGLGWLGNFVVAWTFHNPVSGTKDVQAALYAPNGALLVPTFDVSADPTCNEYEPSAAMDAFGNFVISFTVDCGSGRDVWAYWYPSGGGPGVPFPVATGPLD